MSITNYVRNHKCLCLSTFGLAIIGYLGYRIVKWIIETCDTTKKVKHLSKKVFTAKEGFEMYAKVPCRYFTYEEVVQAIKPWGKVEAIMKPPPEDHNVMFIVKFNKPLKISRTEKSYEPMEKAPFMLSFYKENGENTLIYSEDMIAFVLPPLNYNMDFLIATGFDNGYVKNGESTKEKLKNITDKEKAQLYLKWITDVGLAFLQKGIVKDSYYSNRSYSKEEIFSNYKKKGWVEVNF